MDISLLLTPERTVCRVANCHSKKRTLEVIANLMSEKTLTLSAHEIFSALIDRERLGSTGLDV